MCAVCCAVVYVHLSISASVLLFFCYASFCLRSWVECFRVLKFPRVLPGFLIPQSTARGYYRMKAQATCPAPVLAPNHKYSRASRKSMDSWIVSEAQQGGEVKAESRTPGAMTRMSSMSLSRIQCEMRSTAMRNVKPPTNQGSPTPGCPAT